VAPNSRLADSDEPGFSQVGQVPRNSRLWGVKTLDYIAHTEFSVTKNVENPKPSPVGESPKHEVNYALRFGLRCLRGASTSWCYRRLSLTCLFGTHSALTLNRSKGRH